MARKNPVFKKPRRECGSAQKRSLLRMVQETMGEVEKKFLELEEAKKRLESHRMEWMKASLEDSLGFRMEMKEFVKVMEDEGVRQALEVLRKLEEELWVLRGKVQKKNKNTSKI